MRLSKLYRAIGAEETRGVSEGPGDGLDREQAYISGMPMRTDTHGARQTPIRNEGPTSAGEFPSCSPICGNPVPSYAPNSTATDRTSGATASAEILPPSLSSPSLENSHLLEFTGTKNHLVCLDSAHSEQASSNKHHTYTDAASIGKALPRTGQPRQTPSGCRPEQCPVHPWTYHHSSLSRLCPLGRSIRLRPITAAACSVSQ